MSAADDRAARDAEVDAGGQHPNVSGAAPLIGVFDSGVGGLTVVAALRRRLPAASILYLGDTARLPYGTKSRRTVLRYSQTNVDFLEQHGVDALVVACNTASATAFEDLLVRTPHWGVLEPGAQAAAAAARRHVGVIATESTVRSAAYDLAIRRLKPELRVSQQACPLLVPLVEEGWEDDEITERIVARYLEPLLEAKIDTLLLGCTHYPLLRGVLARVCGPHVTLVDSAESTSLAVARRLPQSGWRDGAAAQAPSVRLFATDAGSRFARLAERILGEPVDLEWIDVNQAETQLLEVEVR